MKNKKAEFGWQKIISDPLFKAKITEVRSMFNIPVVDGYLKEFFPITVAFDSKSKSHEEKTKSYNKFQKEVDKIADYYHDIAGFENMGIKKKSIFFSKYGTRLLSRPIGGYILYGTIDMDYIENINTTSCSLFYVSNTKEKIKLENGLYFKIQPSATKTDIALFFKMQEENIWRLNDITERDGKEHFNIQDEKSNKKRYKTSNIIKKNNIVVEHSKKTIKELQTESGSLSRSKDILISILMSKEDMPTKPDNVRKILGRQRK